MHPDIKTYNISNMFMQEMRYRELEALKQWGIMGWMGYSLGEHLHNSAVAEDVATAVAALGGNLDLIATYADEDEDSRETHTYRRPTTVQAVCDSITEDRYYEVGDLSKIKTLKDLASEYANHLSNGGGQLCSLRTVAEQTEWETEQRRKELEGAAKRLAATKKVTLGTMDFIRAVEDELADNRHEREQWNNPEVRMEEWAAHRFAGGGSESYFDDLNYVNGGISNERDTLVGILDWLRVECPLLMAKYEEQKLAGKWESPLEELV